jgi:hypothetical protein
MKHASTSIHCIAAAVLAAAVSFNAVAAEGQLKYEVTVTNLTRGVSFTPILVATHQPDVHLFALGQPASEALAAMAEGGDTSLLAADIDAMQKSATASSAGLLEPGQSVTITVSAHSRASHLSLAAMMLPTNDGFIALNSVPLPPGGKTGSYISNGHDAGSEPNDEFCASIPGPTCGGEGITAGVSGEGYVHVHAGIHGVGDLQPSEYDWRNPVARITVRRMNR